MRRSFHQRKMRGQIRGLKQASRNAQDGISMIQTAEGALNETHSILQRMRELVVQAGNTGTLEEEDLQAIKDEITELNNELTDISTRTEFNGTKLLDGNYKDQKLQIGANATQQLTVTINSGSADKGFSATHLGVNNLLATITGGNYMLFDADIASVDTAIEKVSAALQTVLIKIG